MLRTKKSARLAFSLTELLVVIAVIAILAGLLGAAVMKMIPSQQRKNTEQTLLKVNSLLRRHWAAVVDQARDEANQKLPTPTGRLFNSTNFPEIFSWATSSNGLTDPERAKVIWVKVRLRHQFPMSYAEAGDFTGVMQAVGLSPETAYLTALSKAGITAATYNSIARPQPTEKAACLLLALSLNRKGVQMDSDLLHALELRDTDNDKLNEIVDGWGTPVGFYRFPINDPNVGKLNPSSSAQFLDPQDPTGRLWDPTWIPSPGYTELVKRGLVHAIINAPPTRTSPPFGAYHVPIIVSAGKDKKLGLSDDGKPLSADADDNIYSYDIR